LQQLDEGISDNLQGRAIVAEKNGNQKQNLFMKLKVRRLLFWIEQKINENTEKNAKKTSL
jgi:hypothetical protein